MERQMAKYRQNLPQLGDKLFLTDGGIETTLVFREGIDLPAMAAFTLMPQKDGQETLRRYFRRYAELARARGAGFVLESATWRASPDWGSKLGYTRAELAAIKRTSIGMLADVRAEFETAASPMVISGCLGPRGDGYVPGEVMSEAEAEDYHAWQVGVFRDTAADMVTAITMTNVAEAIGITRAAHAAGMPVAISFTTEIDGRLPTGQPLGEAIETVDEATAGGPAYYMINCAHPTHFADALRRGGAWVRRLRGLRANASCKSHAELDTSTALDDGDPVEFGLQHAELRRLLPHLTVLGGCCGTDHRHIEQIGLTCIGLRPAA